jgi:hypothetical protein
MSEAPTPHDHEKQYRIYVDGTEKTVTAEVLSFEQVVNIAYPSHDPQTIYRVTFEKAKEPHEGRLLADQSVEIKNGTEFDVTPVGRS